MKPGFATRLARAATGALAALACCVALPTFTANAQNAEGPTYQAAADGTVPAQSTDGPQVTKVRLLKEGTFLEVHWNEYVDETQAVNVDNFTLTNGGKTVTLRPKANDGVTDTYYFDKDNKEVAAESGKLMQYLDPSIHMSNIAYSGTIDPTKPITLTIKGSAIKDNAGKAAQDATYTNVPVTSYYTKTITTKAGIVVKSDDGVSDKALQKTAELVDAELNDGDDNGIAQEMVKQGNSVAVYGDHEIPQMIPEQRYLFDKTMYAAEGYGGYLGDGFVSSISEKNVLRTTGDPDPAKNTAYTDESVLIHEFGHAIKLGGLDQMPDQTLANTFYKAYAHAKETGLWANTYAYQNSDEFFATMATIWFNVMSESWDGSYDGTRSPINTRDELKAYDPQTYEALSQIFPATTLPSPWESTPNKYGLDLAKTQPPVHDAAAATNPDLKNDLFQIFSDHSADRGDVYYLERLTSAPGGGELDLATVWGAANDLDNSLDSWNVVKVADDTYAFASAVTDSQPQQRGLTANADGTVTVAGHAFDASDPAQQWHWYVNESSSDPYDGYLVNVKYGKALTPDGNPFNGNLLVIRDIDSHTLAWSLRDLTQSIAANNREGLFVVPTAKMPAANPGQDNGGKGDGSHDNAGQGGADKGNAGKPSAGKPTSGKGGATAAADGKIADTGATINAAFAMMSLLLAAGVGLALTRQLH